MWTRPDNPRVGVVPMDTQPQRSQGLTCHHTWLSGARGAVLGTVPLRIAGSRGARRVCAVSPRMDKGHQPTSTPPHQSSTKEFVWLLLDCLILPGVIACAHSGSFVLFAVLCVGVGQQSSTLSARTQPTR